MVFKKNVLSYCYVGLSQNTIKKLTITFFKALPGVRAFSINGDILEDDLWVSCTKFRAGEIFFCNSLEALGPLKHIQDIKHFQQVTLINETLLLR